jgi:hypothetical protein
MVVYLTVPHGMRLLDPYILYLANFTSHKIWRNDALPQRCLESCFKAWKGD